MLWDLRTAWPLAVIESHNDKVLCADWWKGDSVISGGADSKLCISSGFLCCEVKAVIHTAIIELWTYNCKSHSFSSLCILILSALPTLHTFLFQCQSHLNCSDNLMWSSQRKVQYFH
ncbi:hypothetical protein ACB092_12G221300 [Castanea dentata]